MKTTEEVKNLVTETFVQGFASFGFSPTMSQVYMELFFSDEPIGMKEISEKTGYSVSTVSTCLEHLERFADIRKFTKPGSKKIFYECEHDIVSTQTKKFNASKKIIRLMIGSITSAIEKLGDKLPEDESTKSKLIKMKEDYESMDTLISKVIELHAQNTK